MPKKACLFAAILAAFAATQVSSFSD